MIRRVTGHSDRSAPVGARGLASRSAASLAAAVVVVALAIVGLPAPAGAAGAGFVSDDFSAPTLDDHWSITDPRGDGTVELTGTDTADARLSLSVPAGTAHDAWTPNNALRVTQPVTDDDLAIDTKFDSAPTRRYQMQGISIHQDQNTWLRADYYHDGSDLRLFTSTFTPGGPTIRTNTVVPTGSSLWLRVQRSNDQWTVSSSTDGTSWTTRTSFAFTMTTTSAGVFAGNAVGATSPAFTALVDYAFATTSPITPEDPTGTTTTTTTPPTTTTTPPTTTTTTPPTTTTAPPTHHHHHTADHHHHTADHHHHAGDVRSR